MSPCECAILCDGSHPTLCIPHCNYHIASNVLAAQFSWIGVLKNFAETIFLDHGFRYSAPIRYSKISRSLIFEVRCQSVKKRKK